MLLIVIGGACLVLHEAWTKAVAVVFFFLAMSCLGCAQVVTAVEGESWLEHLHRSFNETSMGKSSGIYGPAAPMPSEWPLPHPTLKLSNKFTEQSTILSGVDLYRLKCQGCHGASGTGDPPEINSVIDPVRATSSRMYIARMKKVGMDVTSKDAAPLAKQAKGMLLDRLHKGGTDMPSPNPNLDRCGSPLAVRISAAACRHPRRGEAANSDCRGAIARGRAHREIYMPYLPCIGWP